MNVVYLEEVESDLRFAVYYLLSEETIEVCAILDMRRDPGWIREELQARHSG